MRKLLRIWLALLTLFLPSRAGLSAQDKECLHLVQTIPMPNVKGRIDHMDVDVKDKRLFVAGLENGSLEVVDLQAGKWSKSLPGFKKPQGVAYVPSLNKVFVASGDDGMLSVFRGDTLEPLDTIKLDIGPTVSRTIPTHDFCTSDTAVKMPVRITAKSELSMPRRTGTSATSKWKRTLPNCCWITLERRCSFSSQPRTKFKSSIRRCARWCPHGPSAASGVVTEPSTKNRAACLLGHVRPRK